MALFPSLEKPFVWKSGETALLPAVSQAVLFVPALYLGFPSPVAGGLDSKGRFGAR